MNRVDRKEFLAMPAGTLFQKADKYSNLDRLMLKHDTTGNDFFYEDIAPIEAFKDSYFLDNVPGEDYEPGWIGRDGLYDEDQVFVVWSREDVLKMVELVCTKVLGYKEVGHE